MLSVSVCLFFNSSGSLLIDSCIFSILFSRFLINFILNYFFMQFAYFFFIYLDFCVSSLLLICEVFPYLFLKKKKKKKNLLCLRSPFPSLQG